MAPAARNRSTAAAPAGAAWSLLHVKVVPGSSRNRVAGRYAQGIKAQVSAAAEQGKANAAVTQLLADFLALHPSQVELVSGHVNPRKIYRIHGLSAAALGARLRSAGL